MQECVYTFHKEQPIQIAQNKFWRPYQPKYFISPNFPAYPSGHSTFGAAFVEVWFCDCTCNRRNHSLNNVEYVGWPVLWHHRDAMLALGAGVS